MINKYYTKKLLFELLKIINEHKIIKRKVILQKNNDFNHETINRKNNSIKSFKSNNNIELLKHDHLIQSLNLNSHKEI